jgi:hypothetical protein
MLQFANSDHYESQPQIALDSMSMVAGSANAYRWNPSTAEVIVNA